MLSRKRSERIESQKFKSETRNESVGVFGIPFCDGGDVICPS